MSFSFSFKADKINRNQERLGLRMEILAFGIMICGGLELFVLLMLIWPLHMVIITAVWILTLMFWIFLCPRNKKFEIIGVVLLFIGYDFVVMKNGYIFWIGFISLMGTPIFIIIAYQLKKLYLRNKKNKNDKKITDIHIQ